MVRLTPPISRVLTLGLNAFFQQDAVPPTTAGLSADRGAGAQLEPAAAAAVREPVPSGASLLEASTLPEHHYLYGVRTAEDARVPAAEALEQLREGNKRFVTGHSRILENLDNKKIKALAEHGQAPMASILGCADARAPPELLFDMTPGDLFVLRNAGNTFSNAESSLVGSLEYSVDALGVKLIVVLGHTKCLAIRGATDIMLARQGDDVLEHERQSAATETMLAGLGPVTEQAQLDLGGSHDAEHIACKAVKVNIFDGIEKLLIYSDSIREQVRNREVQVQGAMYDIETGKVEFIGQHPRLPLILGMQAMLKSGK